MASHIWRVAQRREIAAIHCGRNRSFPQIAALHLDSGYFRLTPPGCGWGTSVVLLPTLWATGALFQGAPIRVRWNTRGEVLEFCFVARIAHLDVRGEVRLHAPEADSVRASVAVRVESDAALDCLLDLRAGEAFKPMLLSSMRLDDELWDAQSAFLESRELPLRELPLRELPLPARGWIIEPGASGHRFGLKGGTSRWKMRAPSVEIALENPLSVSGCSVSGCSVSGWVTPSDDPNDDNVGLWAASDRVLRAWNYSVVASFPDAPNGIA